VIPGERIAVAAGLLAVAFLLIAAPARADVVETTAAGFLVRQEATIDSPPDKVYRALASEVGRWWNPEHTYSGDAANLSIDARPGGCFCEKLPDGGGVEHLTVAYIAPGKLLRLRGALGPLGGHGLAGSMTWSLAPAGTGTKVVLTYSVGGYMQGGFDKMAPAVSFVLGEQLGRLKSYVETGKPAAPK
jgi:uncharacterized protein YndB with AHSA1/START domain